jgi:hypothetical protein
VKLFSAQRRETARELTETGKIKHAAPSEVVRWMSAAWKAILESIIIRSFKKYSNKTPNQMHQSIVTFIV